MSDPTVDNETAFINDKGEQVNFTGPAQAPPPGEPDVRTIDCITAIAYEAVREYEHWLGQTPTPSWDELTQEQREDFYEGVVFIASTPSSSLANQHDRWRSGMAANAWRAPQMISGLQKEPAIKDEILKIHPNMVPWDQLAPSQQIKARLWRHVVHAIIG